MSDLRRPASEVVAVEELPPVRGAVADLVEAVALDDWAELHRRQKLDELARGGRTLRADRDAGRERADALHLVRQRADVVDAFDRDELADLLKAELGVAACDDGADALALDAAALGRDLVGQAEAREELRCEIRAANARRVCDGARLAHRADERVDGGDVGFRRAGAHGHADARQHEIAARAGLDLAGRDQRVDGLRRGDDDVGALAAREPRRKRVGGAARRRAEHRDDVVTGAPLEPRRRVLERGREGPRRHHHDVVGQRRQRQAPRGRCCRHHAKRGQTYFRTKISPSPFSIFNGK